jgi:hypothetical protein
MALKEVVSAVKPLTAEAINAIFSSIKCKCRTCCMAYVNQCNRVMLSCVYVY